MHTPFSNTRQSDRTLGKNPCWQIFHEIPRQTELNVRGCSACVPRMHRAEEGRESFWNVLTSQNQRASQLICTVQQAACWPTFFCVVQITNFNVSLRQVLSFNLSQPQLEYITIGSLNRQSPNSFPSRTHPSHRAATER
jgi:hypothetical protein